MSAEEIYTLLLDATGVVVRVAVGAPADVPVEEGQTALERSGDAAAAWAGWTFSGGTWTDPNAPPPPAPPSAEELLAHAHEAHLAAEARGTSWNGWPVAVNERALTRMLGERLAAQDGVRSDTDPWTFADGVARPLSNADLAKLSQRMRRHIGVCLAVYNQVAAGIAAGAVIAAAQIDGAFAGVDALVLQGAAA